MPAGDTVWNSVHIGADHAEYNRYAKTLMERHRSAALRVNEVVEYRSGLKRGQSLR
jgi:hypothetical protein